MTDRIVRTFLASDFSLVLLLVATALGVVALQVTPREEDPQIVVPLADVFVDAPGHSAEEIERLVVSPLERILYQIDGVEYVYSAASRDRAVVTVRFYVGEDRERSLVKLKKRIDEHLDLVPAIVRGFVVKPVEIDDVPIVTLTLRSATTEPYLIRRVAEEYAERLAAVEDVSRITIHGGTPRTVRVRIDPERLAAYGLTPTGLASAIGAANRSGSPGIIRRDGTAEQVEFDALITTVDELRSIVVGVHDDRPVALRDVATIADGPDEIADYVRHGVGPAQGFAAPPRTPGTLVGGRGGSAAGAEPLPAVTLAFAKKKGTNAVRVADAVLEEAEALRGEIVPDDIDVVVTRNTGWTADRKVDELVEALAVAILIVIGLLGISLGWREAFIVAVAVPVVFGLTLALNLMFGFTINRVTLFALILSLGLLVDDPIVDVENITRHFERAGRASRSIVLAAVAEIRPPLIAATLAVIVSFLPMSFITGMMGPYMRPMAANVPVAMLMSMLVAFTITPWLSYRVLGRRYRGGGGADDLPEPEPDPDAVKQTALYRFFFPLMAPILRSRARCWGFMAAMLVATAFAVGIAVERGVPLKMLPFDDKNEMLLVLDFDEGTPLEDSDACARRIEEYLASVREVTDFTSYVGTHSPIDFNGLVRHYYLRRGDAVAEIRVNLVYKRNRRRQSHALALSMRPALERIAAEHRARLKIVEIPPGPPVLSTIVAEVYGGPDKTYEELIDAAETVTERLRAEPFVVDVDDSVTAPWTRHRFIPDREKAALSGVDLPTLSAELSGAIEGVNAGLLHAPHDRLPVRILARMSEADRSGTERLGRLRLAGAGETLVPLAEIGRFEESAVEPTIYHKNLRRVVYVFADTAGRPPADVILDVEADRTTGDGTKRVPQAKDPPRPLDERSFLAPGGGIPWSVADGVEVRFDGEGEWDITLDVFRDLGLAFAAALLLIYIILVAQTGSFAIPVVVMLAIPLTILGILPGFWLLNAIGDRSVAGFADPVFFTATGMIGMIALAGIVTRDSIILVDFVRMQTALGRPLFDAIMESRVIRLRPILLTASTAMLSALPITIDPIFSGLAWSLIFGLLAATLFTLFVIPIAWWLLYATPEDRADAATRRR